MMNFYGFLSYPHGGRVSAMLLISMAVAVVCTCYAISSCRLFTLTFQSKQGDFDQYFYQNDPEDKVAIHTVGVGLFTWLRPFDTLSWQEGTCSGYNELQRKSILDSLLDAIRICGILAVVLSISMFLFAFSMTCLSLPKVHRYLIVFVSVLVGIFTGVSFLITRSHLCTNVGTNSNCTMDQGALVAIIACVFLVLTALMASLFLQPVSDDKLSPRKARKRKRELREQQMKMIKNIEELETNQRKMEELQKRKERVQRSAARRSARQLRKQQNQISSPPSSPARSLISQTTASLSSLEASPQRTPARFPVDNNAASPIRNGIPETLPQNRNKQRSASLPNLPTNSSQRKKRAGQHTGKTEEDVSTLRFSNLSSGRRAVPQRRSLPLRPPRPKANNQSSSATNNATRRFHKVGLLQQQNQSDPPLQRQLKEEEAALPPAAKRPRLRRRLQQETKSNSEKETTIKSSQEHIEPGESLRKFQLPLTRQPTEFKQVFGTKEGNGNNTKSPANDDTLPFPSMWNMLTNNCRINSATAASRNSCITSSSDEEKEFEDIPLFANRDMSTVIKQQDATQQDVEVFISIALNKIDSMIDEDEEAVTPRMSCSDKALYEV